LESVENSGVERYIALIIARLLNSIEQADSWRIQKIESLQTQNNELTKRTMKYEQDLEALTTQNMLLEVILDLRKLDKIGGKWSQVEFCRKSSI
jgi:hypothetical protein